MKYFLAFLFFIITAPKISFSQEVKKPDYYKYVFDPHADAEKDLSAAIKQAGEQHKRVFIVVGGDWSNWSSTFYRQLMVHKDWSWSFVFVPVNFSPLNKNTEILTKLQCPKDQGYPIIMILDETGKKLLTRTTDALKADRVRYDELMLLSFINQWRPAPAKETTRADTPMKKNLQQKQKQNVLH